MMKDRILGFFTIDEFPVLVQAEPLRDRPGTRSRPRIERRRMEASAVI